MNIVALASDHAGFDLKETLKQDLSEFGWKTTDLGTDNAQQSVDYPDYAQKMAQWLKQNPDGKGILICGSGIGMSIAANRHKHVRAALACNGLAAQLSRQHNDANVICLGSRILGVEMARFCVRQFLSTQFEGGRHKVRIEKLNKGE